MTRRRRILLSIVGVLVIVGAATWFLALAPFPATDFAETPCDGRLACVIRVDDGIAALPSNDQTDPSIGFVFYTGARVAPEAYAPVAARVADGGYPVWIPKLRLNLAVLDQDAAAGVIADHPEIDRWIVAGHSLGGAMAARYASTDDLIDGLALLAAYPEDGLDLSESDLSVTSVYGTEDGLATVDEVLEAAPRLPPDTAFVGIEGGNHAQFGNYGDQRGDNPASISAEAQWDVTADALVALARAVEATL